MGVAYAFQVGVVNPVKTPDVNLFTFTTSVGGVVLHRQDNIPGLVMRELDIFEIIPSNPTKLVSDNLITFRIESVKSVPGGSRFIVTAPKGFVFTCSLQGVISLTASTTCLATNNILTLTSDKTLSIAPNSLIQFSVFMRNPPSTPQTNLWRMEIKSPQGTSVDVRNNIAGFDVTGVITGNVSTVSTYLNQKSVVTISFAPSTAQTRAVSGNAIIVTAPSGYTFPSICESVSLRAVSSNLAVYPVPTGNLFPPIAFNCSGYVNGTAAIVFAHGFGLHLFNYQLTIAVVNANVSSADTLWMIRTSSPDLITGAMHTMDFNSSVPGYALTYLTTA
jgi:hypothetical protein